MIRIYLNAIAMFAAILTVNVAWAAETDKNPCLVYGMNCPSKSDSLPEKIAKLEAEISKGRRVYSEAEIARLEQKLGNENAILRSLHGPGK